MPRPAASNLLLRVASAVVALPVLGALVLWHEPLGFAGFTLLATTLALAEYTGLTLPDRPPGERAVVVALGSAFAVALYLRPALGLLWAMIVILLVAALVLVRPGEISAAAARLTAAGFGVFYVGGLIVALPLLQRDVADGRLWVLAALAATSSDGSGGVTSWRLPCRQARPWRAGWGDWRRRWASCWWRGRRSSRR
jgi:CDP-diglyceride synthetase